MGLNTLRAPPLFSASPLHVLDLLGFTTYTPLLLQPHPPPFFSRTPIFNSCTSISCFFSTPLYLLHAPHLLPHAPPTCDTPAPHAFVYYFWACCCICFTPPTNHSHTPIFCFPLSPFFIKLFLFIYSFIFFFYFFYYYYLFIFVHLFIYFYYFYLFFIYLLFYFIYFYLLFIFFIIPKKPNI